jgi:septum formation protein
MEILKFKNPLILGSKSPRRAELLSLITRDFTIESAEVDESIPAGEKLESIVCILAKKKARAIWNSESFQDRKQPLLLCADTLVSVENQILGKPKDSDHAKEMLEKLSDREHSVTTGVVLKDEKDSHSFSVTTRIQFRKLSKQDINLYIQSKEPMDKAGAYGIQGSAASFVKSVNGSYTNVVGLPLSEVFEALSAHPYRKHF